MSPDGLIDTGVIYQDGTLLGYNFYFIIKDKFVFELRHQNNTIELIKDAKYLISDEFSVPLKKVNLAFAVNYKNYFINIKVRYVKLINQ